jgi:hypothetical protein
MLVPLALSALVLASVEVALPEVAPTEVAALPPAPAPPALPSIPWDPAPRRRAADSEGYEFRYGYLEAGYVSTDLDGLGESTDGYRIRGSSTFLGLAYLFSEYVHESVDTSGGDIDSDSLSFGLGAHVGIAPTVDLVGEASWVYDSLDSSVPGYDGSQGGWTALIGSRAMLLPWETGGLEFDAGVQWIDRGRALLTDTETIAFVFSTRAHFLERFSVAADYQWIGDDGRGSLSARFSF